MISRSKSNTKDGEKGREERSRTKKKANDEYTEATRVKTKKPNSNSSVVSKNEAPSGTRSKNTSRDNKISDEKRPQKSSVEDNPKPVPFSNRKEYSKRLENVSKLIVNWENLVYSVYADANSQSRIGTLFHFLESLNENYPGYPPSIFLVDFSLFSYIYTLIQYSKIKFLVFPSKFTRSHCKKQALLYKGPNKGQYSALIITKDAPKAKIDELSAESWSTFIIDDAFSAELGISTVISSFFNLKFSTLIASSSSLMVDDIAFHSLISEISFAGQPKLTKNSNISFDTIIMQSEDDVPEEFFDETLFLIPQVSTQIKTSMNILIENLSMIKSGSLSGLELCFICKNLYDISSYPISESETFDELEGIDTFSMKSSKVSFLIRLLKSSYCINKRIAICCSDSSIVRIICKALSFHAIPYSALSESTNSNPIENGPDSSLTNAATTLVITDNEISHLSELNSNYVLVLFDSRWIPILDYEFVIRTRESHPLVYRILSSNTMEDLLFRYYWNHRQYPPSVMLTHDNTNYEDMKKILVLCANNLNENDSVRGSSWCQDYLSNPSIINYSHKSSIDDVDLSQYPDDFWDNFPPKPSINAVGKQKSMVSYWDKSKILRFIEIMRSYGWGRWEFFDEFSKPSTELQRIGAVILSRMRKSYDISQLKNTSALFEKLTSFVIVRTPVSPEVLDDSLVGYDLEPFFRDFEIALMLLLLSKIGFIVNIDDPDNFYLIAKDVSFLKSVFNKGVSSVYESKYSIDQLFQLLTLLNNDASTFSSSTNVNPKEIITTSKPRKFSTCEHDRIVQTLLRFGYDDPSQFREASGLKAFPLDVIVQYVEKIISLCNATSIEEKRSIQSKLSDKVLKYTTQILPTRLKWFSQIRSMSKDMSIPAEEHEFLIALSVHGTYNTDHSPTLQCLCSGNCTETRLCSKMKTFVLELNHNGYPPEKHPIDSTKVFPIRINDMIMIESFGIIDSRDDFHNEYYVYPIGFHSTVVAKSISSSGDLIWVDQRVAEGTDGNPLFSIFSESDSLSLTGSSPDDVWEQYREKLQMKSKKNVPMFCGAEMFGFTSSLYHHLLFCILQNGQCHKYVRRVFKNPQLIINCKRPTIGVFEKSFLDRVLFDKSLPKNTQSNPEIAQWAGSLRVSVNNLDNTAENGYTVRYYNPNEGLSYLFNKYLDVYKSN